MVLATLSSEIAKPMVLTTFSGAAMTTEKEMRDGDEED